ncbi:MAG: nucleotidyl transferase AbiEii/AbiGii toxin family protein [Verrucomicrobia bacterium]|nr:nucleotidyl transferase AbiEii/AbiGii toxin family protein [Verrucomicrobiota bacterium]
MTEVIHAAAELQAVCQSQDWKFCFIGGLALQRWGEPRETVDADLTLVTGFGGEERFIRVLLEHFEGRIPNAAEFALERRVLLLRSRIGVGLDVALGALPFEALAVQRSTLFDYPPKIALRTCSAEDLVVMKAFAGRGQDWVDVERIIVRQTGKLDWEHILKQLRPLAELKGTPEILDQLDKRRVEFEK